MAVGVDRPGIVAAVTEVLLEHGLNIEDSQMTILRGHFTTMLVVSGPPEVDPAALSDALREAGKRVGLESIDVRELSELDPAQPEATHVVTVYGVDHPGIVHAVASALGDRGVNITDLNTRLLPGDTDGGPLYVMMLEVAVPPAMVPDALETALETVGETQGVEVTIRPLEQDAL